MEQDLQALLQRPDVVLAVVLVIVTIIILVAVRSFGKGSKGSSVILAGPINSGKTTLFLQLRDGSPHQGTVSSMAENDAVCAVSSSSGTTSSMRVVDIPGHSSFRSKLDKALRDARGVVFVVDAAEYTSQKQETADILYEVLSNSSIYKGRVPVLVACNKSDLEDQAFSVNFIRKDLEKQLDLMRKTKAAALSDGSSTVVLGKKDKTFSFDDLKGKVTLAAVSALKNDLGYVADFITTL